MPGVLDTLAQSVIPQVFAALRNAGLNDSCTIKAEALTVGTGGDRVTGSTDAYTSVPCSYEPLKGARIGSGDKLLSINAYTVTIPTHTAAGTRINLDPSAHKIVTNARGNEPAKTFRIVSVGDESGVVYSVIAEREN